MEETRKFRFKDLGPLLLNSFKAIFKGEFLLRLKIGRYFIHITACFVIMALTIWVSLLIDNTLTKVQQNNNVISEQQTEIETLTYRLSAATRRSEVEKRLGEMGSDLKDATQPAKEIK